jgi:hypothetical protein
VIADCKGKGGDYLAGFGKVWEGIIWLSLARFGKVWEGIIWQGLARFGRVWQGFMRIIASGFAES